MTSFEFRSRRTLAIAGSIVGLLLVVLLWKELHHPADDEADVVVSVEVAKAERGPIANEITMVATLEPRREATLSPKISGQIAQMSLLTNRAVHAGDVLAVLESRDLAAQRGEAAGALQEAQSAARQTIAENEKAVRDARLALDNAQKTYDRRRSLFDQGGISKKELEASQLAVVDAEGDLRVAEAALRQGNSGATVAEAKVTEARSHLASVNAQLGYSEIRAPFDGVVTEQWERQGDFASPGQKLLTVADTSTLIARTEVAEETAARIKAGDAVKVLPDELHGEAINGTVNLVGRGADPQSRSVEVWVMVPNPTGRLRPNGVAKVVIDAEPVADAVVVPSPAVTLDATNGTTGTVMVVDSKSIAHEVHVTIGVRSGGRTQIVSGLSGGEMVVTEGNYGLPDGTKVAIASGGGE